MRTLLNAALLFPFLVLVGCGGGGGTSSRLVFRAFPVVATDGRTLSTVTVAVLGGDGAIDATSTVPVTVALPTGTTGVALGGTTTVAAVAGVANFTALTITGTTGTVQLEATSGGVSTASCPAFPVRGNATQLVITTTPPTSIAPLRALTVTVELRTATGAVATQLNDPVTLAIDTLPDLLWHASGGGVGVKELLEVTSGVTVVQALPNAVSGEVFGAAWDDTLGTLVITDIANRIGIANATTGDEARFRNGATLSVDLRAAVRDSAGVFHAGVNSSVDHHTIDAFSGVDTVVGAFAFDPAAFTCNGITGLAVQPGTGTVFGIAKTTSSGTSRRLVTVNFTANTLTDVGDMGARFSSLAFSPTGVLYATTGNGSTSPESLFTVSTTTGAVTLVGPLGNGADGEVIALAPRRLRGTTTVNAFQGMATFSDIWFEQIGSSCTLKATTAALTSASSSAVQVTGAVTAGASVQFTAASSSVAENVTSGTATITLALSNTVDYALPVMLTVDAGGTATIGATTPDATLAGAFQVVFAPGELTKDITIPIANDTEVEANETLVVTIRSARLTTSIGGVATHTLTIVSDD